jgi:hypothetical protein
MSQILISAIEAREMTVLKHSDKINRTLEEINRRIKSQASSGSYEVCIGSDTADTMFYHLGHFVQELHSMGYVVRVEGKNIRIIWSHA